MGSASAASSDMRDMLRDSSGPGGYRTNKRMVVGLKAKLDDGINHAILASRITSSNTSTDKIEISGFVTKTE